MSPGFISNMFSLHCTKKGSKSTPLSNSICFGVNHKTHQLNQVLCTGFSSLWVTKIVVCPQPGRQLIRLVLTTMLPSNKLWGLWVMQDNRGTTAADKEFFSTGQSVGQEQTKAPCVPPVECLPRAGPKGDIFSGVLIHYPEDLLPQPPPPFCLSWQMWGRH